MDLRGQKSPLGFAEIDVQHDYLFWLFGLVEQDTRVINQKATKSLLGEIERYLMIHFAFEEHLMRAYGFPGFSVHQSDHERVASKFVEFLDAFEAGALNPAALGIFLTGWLLEHSRLSDSEYVAWITRQRQVLNPQVTQ